MLNSSILKKVALLFVGAVFIISCDKDFDGIGSNIVADDHSEFSKEEFPVDAFSQKTGPVETTNLPVNPLGIFSNGKFGKTTANFVSQVQLASENPTFTSDVTEARVKSVILKIPYFSHVKETTSDATTYELDSIYGSETAKMVLNVYENGYYMRDFDPGTNFQAQKYYSDQDDVFNTAKRGTDAQGNSISGGTRLNNATASGQNEQFVFSPAEITIPAATEDGDPTKEAPQMRLELDKKFFYKKLIETPDANLVNNNVFKQHFKGLYFQIEEISGGALAMLDFSKATITMTYAQNKTTIVNGVETIDGTVDKTVILNLSGNSASLLKHTATTESADYEVATGTEELYLKGGEGSVAFIDLFGGGDSPQLEALRTNAINNNWLINEANLVFNVEQNDMLNTIDPNRIYLYDARNYTPLSDYYFDQTPNQSNQKYIKLYHSGIVQLTGSSGDANRKATKYKIRITEHIKNLIYKDSTNVRLGLSITENIANVSNKALKTPTSLIKKLPTSSVLSPLGTIIFGSSNSTPQDKKLKLEITFTKPN